MFLPVNNESDFSRITSEYPSTLIIAIFHAEWCGACRRKVPLVYQLEQSHPNVIFVKLNIDEFKGLAELFNIHTVPTFVPIYNGNYYGLIQGDLNQLEQTIRYFGY